MSSITLGLPRTRPSDRLDIEKYRELFRLVSVTPMAPNYLDSFYRFFSSATKSHYPTLQESLQEKASSTADNDEENVPSLGEIMRKLRKEDPALFQRLIKDDTRR